MQCQNCGYLNSDDQLHCLRCSEPLQPDPVFPQANQEAPPDQMQQAPPPPPSIMQPPPMMQPPPNGMQQPMGYPPMHGGGGFGPAFDIPEAGRSGMNEIIMGSEGANDAPTFSNAIIGVVLSVITVGILLPFKESHIYAVDILINRGFWPYTMIFTFWTGLSMTLWKFIGLQKMKGVLKKELIPPQTQTITPKNADNVLQNIKSLYSSVRCNPLVYRVWMALLIFKQTSLVERVDTYCSQQSDAEGGNMDASYQIINFCLWLQPIFGFLGTVQGLGLALAGFGNIAGSAMEIDTIKTALASVTGGLSTAFDTTLLGLLNSVIMMTVITLLKKSEDAFLSNVDVWIKENLIPKLKAPPVNLEEAEGGGGGDPTKADRFKRIIEETFQTYIQSLEGAFDGWKDGFSGILGKLNEETENMGDQFKSVEPLVTDFRKAMDDFSNEVKETSEHQKGLLEAVDAHFNKLDPLITSFQDISSHLNQERQQLDQQMKTWVQNLDGVAKSMAQQIKEAGKEFLNKADQFQKQSNQNATQLSAVVGQKLIETGQGIIAPFQQHIQEFSSFQREQAALAKNQAENLTKLSENLSRNMTHIGDNLLQRFEGQTTGMETLQKDISSYLSQFDSFNRDFQQQMKNLAESQTRNIDTLSSKTMEVFKNQLKEWFQSFSREQTDFSNKLTNSFTNDFNKIGQDILGQFGQYAQKQDQNSRDIMNQLGQYVQMQGQGASKGVQDIKNLEQAFGKLASQLGTAFNQLNQNMSKSFNQNLQGLSSLSSQFQNLINQQKEATQMMNQHASGLSSSEAAYGKGIEELREILAPQQQLIATLNEGIKQQAESNSSIKEVLNGINSGIESIKPYVQNLAESLKVKE